MRRILLLAFCLTGVALADDAPTYAGDAHAKYGRAHQVLAPIYPEEALRAGESGAVTVTGVIAPQGMMDSASFAPAKAADEIFVAPLREALPFWLFDVPYGNDCMPSTQPVSVKVEFEVRDGKPHVFLTYAAPESVPPRWQGSIAGKQHPQISYPRSMIQAGNQAVVFSRSEVGPDGHVNAVVARAFPKPGNRSEDLGRFVAEVRDTLSQWTYPPEPSKPLRKVCHTIEFNLK